MSVYPLLLHIVACLWYIFFWNNFLGNGGNEENWHPKFRDIQDIGTRYLTNWNLVSNVYFSIKNYNHCFFVKYIII